MAEARPPEAGAAGPGEPRSPETWVAVNGERRPLPAGACLLELLDSLGITLETQAVAVAVNERLMRRAEWAAHRLAPEDRVEVVRAIQGG